MPRYETLTCTFADTVATVTLDRPQALNALSRQMTDELIDVLVHIRDDAGVHAMVLRGAGDAFCAGGDVHGMAGSGPRSAAQARGDIERYRRLTLELARLDRPVIAAVDGVAYGAGFSLVLLADIVLLSDRARLCMAFQRVGLIPDCGALYSLPRIVGLQRAKELVFSGRVMGAPEALAIGIAMEVLPPHALHARAAEIAASLANASPVALSLAKRALNASMHSDLETMLEMEISGQAIALTSDYVKEAARRFVAKEPASFRWPARLRAGDR